MWKVLKNALLWFIFEKFGQRFLLQGAEKSCHEETVPLYNSFQINLPMIPSFYFFTFYRGIGWWNKLRRNAVYAYHFISEGMGQKRILSTIPHSEGLSWDSNPSVLYQAQPLLAVGLWEWTESQPQQEQSLDVIQHGFMLQGPWRMVLHWAKLLLDPKLMTVLRDPRSPGGMTRAWLHRILSSHFRTIQRNLTFHLTCCKVLAYWIQIFWGLPIAFSSSFF